MTPHFLTQLPRASALPKILTGTGGEVVGRLAANHPMAAKPIFTRADGSAFDTGDVRAAAKRMAKACGEDPDRFGGKSFRVGGATDMRIDRRDLRDERERTRGRLHGCRGHGSTIDATRGQDWARTI